MKAYHELPKGYEAIHAIDLKKDKRLMLLVNGLAVVIMLVFGVLGHFIVPITEMYGDPATFTLFDSLIRCVAWIAGVAAYIPLHEFTHSVAMKLCGTKKVRFGSAGIYAYAGSDDYYDIPSYIFIALAPVVFWGIVLLVLNIIVPRSWFWVVYFLQLANLSGSAGDLYVTVAFSRFPKGTLVKDAGVSMTLYNRRESA